MLEPVPEDVLQDLHRRHAEPQRHYHDWSHIEALLGHLDGIASQLHDPQAVQYAILFHDAVYDPRAKDNERRSAELLITAAPPLPRRSLANACRMIEATEGHFLPDDLEDEARDDCAHFLDMDLGILGASPQRFAIYEDQIRREYAHVPDDAFREGRGQVLRHFAERETLYFSEWGKDRFEEQARSNLARSLAALEG
ncbi:hypothetical protein [uncultured Erythrobacter sp.]|uniref:HD domain-containing protein n=1 Tax=uncultured Erythrobacter sp. TaxID=263913 RepID=UPI002639A717|nr:hypothetical protein [uncultured Erythrobacter sp.]